MYLPNLHTFFLSVSYSHTTTQWLNWCMSRPFLYSSDLLPGFHKWSLKMMIPIPIDPDPKFMAEVGLENWRLFFRLTYIAQNSVLDTEIVIKFEYIYLKKNTRYFKRKWSILRLTYKTNFKKKSGWNCEIFRKHTTLTCIVILYCFFSLLSLCGQTLPWNTNCLQ